MRKEFCDSCEKELPIAYVSGEYRQYTSQRCYHGSHGQFHDTCLTKVHNQLYCKTHSNVAENKKLVSEYVASVWTDMGYPGSVGSAGYVSAPVGPLNMEIEPEYDQNTTNLTSVILNVKGLTSKPRQFRANLCDHVTTVKQLQGAIVRSLRSTKSSITQKKKQMDEDVAKMDVLIAELMAKLDGTMPDDNSISVKD